jgi:hypothetical protein
MALNYDLKLVKGWKEKVKDKTFSDLIWPFCSMLMVIELGTITKENKFEFLRRVREYENQEGFLFSWGEEHGEKKPVSVFDEESVNRFEGIRTNILTKSSAYWKRKLKRMAKA